MHEIHETCNEVANEGIEDDTNDVLCKHLPSEDCNYVARKSGKYETI